MKTYSKQELQERKEILFAKMRADDKMKGLSDADIKTTIDVLYKLEVKHGFLKVTK